MITEKLPTGVIDSEYIYITPPWSKGEKVLTRVVRKQVAENKVEETENYLIYEKQSNNKWMLSKISINTKQILNVESKNEITRKITESFSFYDYKITEK